MIRYSYTFSLCLLSAILFFCSFDANEQKKERSKSLVNRLVSEIILMNPEGVDAVYPNAPHRMCAFEAIRIESYEFNGDTAVIFGTGVAFQGLGKENEKKQKVKFKALVGAQPKILESNGLSYHYYSALHKLLSAAGCLPALVNDRVLDLAIEATTDSFDKQAAFLAGILSLRFSSTLQRNATEITITLTNETYRNFYNGELTCVTEFSDAQRNELGSIPQTITYANAVDGADYFSIAMMPKGTEYINTYVSISADAIKRLVKERPDEYVKFFPDLCK